MLGIRGPWSLIGINRAARARRIFGRMLALFADIHANLEALDACLAHARARGARRCAFLGDLVGYGADPGAVVDRIAALAREGAIVVQGNHDAAVDGPSGYLNDSAARAIRWTREALDPSQREFLRKLPLCVRKSPACFVHASAAAPDRWEYVDGTAAALRSAAAAGTAFTFSGHMHGQRLFVSRREGAMVAFSPRTGVAIPVPVHRPSLAIPGSVGQPRDGNTAAAYAIVDLEAASITFHRVPYDHLAAARKIRAASPALPASLAYRLERGI